MILRLTPAPLINDTFAPFGDVIESDGADHFSINQGFAERYNNLACVDVHIEDGSANISLVIATHRPAPIAIRMMERHPLGSQIFFRCKTALGLLLSALTLKSHRVIGSFVRTAGRVSTMPAMFGIIRSSCLRTKVGLLSLIERGRAQISKSCGCRKILSFS